MTFDPAQAKNFVELLMQRAALHPQRTALHCLGDAASENASYSFAELDQRARAVAVGLRQTVETGDRVLILLHSGIDYVAAFFGCLYAGVIAVPAFPPESAAKQHVKRLVSIVDDAQPKAILSHSALLDTINKGLAALPVKHAPQILAIDSIKPRLAGEWRMPDISQDAIAFLQYTSGSTASPKGVIVGHDNLLANQRAIKQGFAIGDDDVFVSWLPLYHDMGLVGSLLQPLYSGIPLVLMSPRYFLERPVRWLEAVSRFGGTISGGPDFAFRLCNERISEAQLQGLRLDSWRLAFCGAEPIRYDTLTTFADKFAAIGLSSTAPYPCYGLAEATLLVSGGRPEQAARAISCDPQALAEHRMQITAGGVALVDCGQVQPGHEVAIVDLATDEPCADGRIGEIRYAGPSVAHGYWQNPEASAETFVAADGKTWLRTGDLGFFDQGSLFITGRSKDLILIRGQNLYPQDIEQTLENQIELLRKGRVAAFAVSFDSREGIGIAAEIGRSTQKLVPAENLFDAINEAVAQSCQEPTALILLLNPGALPKTSSGKLQRSACRQGWQDGSLDCYAVQHGGCRDSVGVESAELNEFEQQIAAIWCEVLGIKAVMPQQSFFAVGGQSITAVQVIARLREQLGIVTEPRLFFEVPSLREFAAAVATLNATNHRDALPVIDRRTETDDLLLSFGQESLWFLSQLDPASTAYHIAGGVRIVGLLEPAALQQAFNVLATRHDALRSVFYAVDGQPRQRLLEAAPVDIDYHDLSALDAETAQTQASQRAEAATRQAFDLEHGPLWRVTLVRLPMQDDTPTHELSLSLHHLIADGWSLNRLLAEFAELYAATLNRRVPQLPVLPIRHADYAVWQRSWLEAGESQRQLAYWTDRLGGEQPVIELPYDRPRPTEPSHRGGRVSFALSDPLSHAIQQLARQNSATVFMVLLAAFKVLLYRYSGQTDLRIGLPLANRNRPENQHLIGYFVNTVVLRSELDSRQSFTAFLAQIKHHLLDAQAHPDLPFEQLVDALQPERRLGQNPLFQILINHQQQDFSALQQNGWQIQAMDRDNGAAQFDLSLDTEQHGNGLIGGFFTYATDLFDATTMQSLADHYQQLLAQLTSQPDTAIASQALLTAAEQAQLAAWNVWPKRYDERTPVHELIQRQAEQHPDAVALICGGQTLSYQDLEQQANRLAHRLIELGVRAESRVALLLPRGLDAIVAMLAVLKAGGAYLPLDPEQPGERLAELMADAGVTLAISLSSLAMAPSGATAGLRPRILVADVADVADAVDGCVWLNLDETELSDYPAGAPAVTLHPEQLAYLILTSGSTGKPKSVAVAHGALARHCLAIAERYEIKRDDTALHFAAFTFDAAMEQWLVPLINGCRLVIRDELWSAEQAYHILIEQGVSWFEMPPAYLTEIARWAEQQGLTLPLRACSVGGEAVSKENLAQIRRVVGDAPIVNGYGPTETLITPLVWSAHKNTECDTAYAPIGTGVGERTLYILDKDLNPLPLGAIGELYIGGPCLARGYHGRPDLTAERFIPDLFAADGSRLYRTGDLVRFRVDGNVDYFGRGDHQIKLRGYRIELGEIEAQVLSHHAVSEAVAIADGEGSDKRLLVYAVAAGEITADELKRYLQSRLPDYMIPAQIILLGRLPRLTSGKLDRKALPKPEWTTEQNFRAPQTEAERALIDIWQDVLGLDRIGIDDNFFELGGDSILSIRVVSRAREAGWQFTPRELFLYQTVAGLAVAAQPARQAGDAVEDIVSGEAALSPIQARFFQDDVPNRQHWNLSLLLQARHPLDETKLERALQTLIKHHDSLRLRYRLEDGVWRQYYADLDAGDATDVLWRRNAQDSAEVESIANQAQRSLDLQHGPLLRAVSIRVADGSQRLLLVVHHLVVDGVSWRILLEDLQGLYNGDPALPAKTASFKHWTQRLQDYAASEELNRQLPYWLALAEGGGGNELPRDFPQDAGSFADARTLSLTISSETTRQLLQQAPAAYRTRVNDLLLTALARVLCRWSGRDRVLVELESHGREDLFEDTDLSRSVGWFTSAYPVCLSAIADTGAAIKTVKEQLRSVPDGGLGFGVLKYLAEPGVQAQLAALPQPRVSFNYFGQFDAEQALFEVAPETAGDDRDPAVPLPCWLEINAQVLAGELELRWRYSEKQYRAETVQGLLEAYRAELTALVAHCLSGAKGATPADFGLAGLSQPQIDALPVAIEVVEDIYPLAPMQQGILFHALLEPETGVYVNQMTLDIEGLNVERFAAAWRKAIARHDILRSAFVWRGEADRPLQVVYRQAALPLEILDWRGRAASDAELAALAAEEHARGFDPAQAPLMRLLLVRLSERTYRWIWTSHHILLDGWSTSQLLGEVLQSYAGSERGAGCRYRDFIGWLQQKDPADSERFWRRRLAELDQPSLLAAALGRAGGGGHGSYSERLDANITRNLQDFAQRQHITLNTLLQGTWALVLQRYCGQQTVAFGVTVSGRPADLSGVEGMLGLFINTLPLIVTGRSEQSVGDWLRALQQDNLVLREHEQTPLYDIQRWAGQAGVALFDTLLVFENFPVDAALRNADAGLQFGLPRHIDITHYPLTLNVSVGESLGLAFGYWRDRFDADVVQVLERHFRQLLLDMIEDGERPLANLSSLTAAEQSQLAAWNATPRRYPEGLIHTLISQRAVMKPEAIALAFGEQTLSYAELESRANRLAHYLISQGVGPEIPVGIAVERSLELVVGLLAIVKAGGAYVPLDPDYPADRLAYMIADSGIGLLLSHSPVLHSHADFDKACRCLNLDVLDLSGQPDVAPSPRLHPESPAYIIYTSGSTGRPKGAANSHAALANRLHWMQEAYAIGLGDTVLQKTPFSFDVSVWEFFWPLLTGARLAIAEPGAHRDPAELARLMLKHRVGTLHFVPSMLAEFVNQPELPALPDLKRIVCSGEALPAELQQRVFQRLPGVELDNLYGPTEAAIDVTHWTCRDDGSHSVPIGQPIANSQIHILDAHLNPLPVGVAGELYIGGRGLARGYHRRSGLTAERFIPDPFGSGERLYRTGDRAKWRSDGVIEYLGRLDHQIKLRGLRIELGEIEAALMAQTGIAEAAVLLKDSPHGHYLVAYVATAGRQLVVETLQQGLRQRLPDYMVPAAIVLLDSLPKTVNGKLDRKALPEPELNRRNYHAPHSATERVLAEIWQELLNIDRVGLDDHFFELGGHSLLAMKLVGRVKQSAGVELPVRRIFEIPRLAALAAEIDSLQALSAQQPDLQSELSGALAELQGLSAEDLLALLAAEE